MRRSLKILLTCSALSLLALLLGAALFLREFDWNRAKPWINERISEASGRSFAIHGDLNLSWHAARGETGWRAWVPWPRFTAQSVSLGNANWAQHPTMAEARQVQFSIALLPLLAKRIVIPTLVLDEPQLFLERQEDERNNWSFKRDKRGGWRFEPQRIVLNKGVVHLEDEFRKASLRVDIDTLADDAEGRIAWQASGSYNGERLRGSGKADDLLVLKERDAPYPVEGKLRLASIDMDFMGTITRPGRHFTADLMLDIAAPSLAHLRPLIKVGLPQTQPISAKGRLTRKMNASGREWAYENFDGKIGKSDLSGSLRLTGHRPQARLEGVLSSSVLHFADLRPDSDAAQARSRPATKTRQAPGKLLPVQSFRSERWNGFYMDVRFSGKRILRNQGASHLPVENLETHVRLEQDVLSFAPLKFDFAGGKVDSDIRLDGKSRPVQGEISLAARHLKLKTLFPSLASGKAALGEINAEAKLKGRGNSIAALLGSSNGEIRAVLDHGAVSKSLLDQIGLDLSSLIVTQLFGDKQVRVNCAVSDFTVSKGILQPRAFVIDTEEAAIHVSGNINLARESLGLTITPESKGVRLISLRSPVYVTGSFSKPDVSVDKGVLALKAGSALALGALAPAFAALIPLVNIGPEAGNGCGQLLAQAPGNK